jgi:hypothetical protein
MGVMPHQVLENLLEYLVVTTSYSGWLSQVDTPIKLFDKF